MEGCRFIAATRTAGPLYRLCAFPWPNTPAEAYPGLLEDGSSFVSGEVYEVGDSALKRLDLFEVEGTDYQRRPLSLENGLEAATYYSINIERQGVVYDHPRIGFNTQTNTYTWLNKPAT
jgi:gamma-glutamylcyclotransferase (GGCT)/AIG2-like uncharacterized protein YtfP